MKKLALAIAFSAYVAFATSGNALAAQLSDTHRGNAAIVDGGVRWVGGSGFAPRL